VYLAELLERHRVPTPLTVIFGEDNAALVGERIGFPCVIKQPDSSFSAGVVKVESAEEFERQLPKLFETSELLVAQEFVPTEFDWRIGVLDGEPLFACKYYMARKHWQIYKRDEKGVHSGKGDTLPVTEVPRAVVQAAVKSARLIGDGLFGVDLKVLDGKPKVIEINDNPSIDAGVEDRVLGDFLYERVMRSFLARLEERHR
jgi:glutathione synthase/RimK-type ligase-like ATP-grasp enzyme